MEMRLICIVKKRGVDTFAVITTAENTNHASFIKNAVGVGKPYFLFASLPNGYPSSADFSLAPICNNDVAVNQAAIDEMLENPPWDALIFD